MNNQEKRSHIPYRGKYSGMYTGYCGEWGSDERRFIKRSVRRHRRRIGKEDLRERVSF